MLHILCIPFNFVVSVFHLVIVIDANMCTGQEK